MNSTTILNFSNASFERTQTSHLHTSLYLSQTELAGFILFLGIFGSVGFVQNLIVILSIVLTDGFLDSPANVFHLSLACSDLLVCGVSAPLLIYNSYHWIFTAFITLSKFIVVATTGSIFLLTSHRFFSIVQPLKYPRLMTCKRAVYLTGVIWCIACLVTVKAVIGLTYGIKRMVHITRYFLAFYISVSTVMYVHMHILAREHRGKLRKLNCAVTGQIQSASDEFKALRSLFMIAGSFIACWMPMTISFFFTDRNSDPIQFYRVFSYTAPLVVVNAVLDPTIYYYRSKGFRSSLKMLLRRFQNFTS